MDILRGPCIALAQVAVVPQQAFDPNNKDVTDRLNGVLSALVAADGKNQLSAGLGDYVYFPIHHLLQKDSLSDRQSDYLIQILTILFDKCWDTVELNKSLQLLSVVVYIVSPEAPGELAKFRENSAELHRAAFSCIEAIIRASVRSQTVDEIVKSPSVPQIVTILLASLQYDQDLAAHLAALQTIETFWAHFTPDQMALLLPGVASKLVNFASMSYTKAHVKARARAVTIFGEVVVGCLADSLEESQVRDEKWKSTAVGQVNRSIDTLKALLPKAGTEFVLATTNTARVLAENCGEHLDMSALIEIVTFGAASNFPHVTEAATNAIGSLRSNSSTSKALDNHAVQMVDTLTVKFNCHDETQIIITMDAIRRSLRYVNSEAFLESLVTMIDRGLVITKPKQSQLPQNDSLSLKSLGVEPNISASVEQALVALLGELGQVNGKAVLFSLLDKIQSTPNPLGQTQLLWLAAHVLASYEGDEDTYFDYLDVTFDVVNTAGSLGTKYPPALTSLSVSLLGHLALKLGPKFEAQLVDVLFPVVNLLGSENTAVSHHTRFALQNISKACNYPSLQVMILRNKDYILDGVSLKLNTMDISPATPLMLSTLIRLSGDSIIPYLDDIMASLFVILDNYHGYSVLVTGIFVVFTTVVEILATNVPKSIKHIPRQPLHFESIEAVVEHLLKVPEVPDLPEIPIEDESSNEEEPKIEEMDPEADDIDAPMPEEDEWTSPVAKSSYMIVAKIMGYADRFLTHQSAALRFNLLKLITAALPVLATVDKEFLPSVHKVWPVLVSRLDDEERFVVEAALECLGALSLFSGDFVSSRFQQLWPTLEKKCGPLLKRMWPQFSSEARILAGVEACLVHVIPSTPLDVETLDRVIAAFEPAFKRNEFSDLYSVLDMYAGDQLYVAMTIQ